MPNCRGGRVMQWENYLSLRVETLARPLHFEVAIFQIADSRPVNEGRIDFILAKRNDLFNPIRVVMI